MRAWTRDNRRWTKYVFKRKRDGEIVVLDATNGEKFGPSREQIIRVIRFYRDPKFTVDVKATLWKRIGQKKYPRHVLKGLIILQYLIKHSDQNFRDEAKKMIVQVQMLTTLQASKKEDLDLIARIREEAQTVIDLLSNDAVYAKQRKNVDKKKAAARKSRGTSLGYDDYYGGYGTETGHQPHPEGKAREAPVHTSKDVFDRPTDPYMDEDEGIQEFVNTIHPIRPSPIAPQGEIQWPQQQTQQAMQPDQIQWPQQQTQQPMQPDQIQWPQQQPQQMQMQPQPPQQMQWPQQQQQIQWPQQPQQQIQWPQQQQQQQQMQWPQQQQMQMQPQQQQMQMQWPQQGMLIDTAGPATSQSPAAGEIFDFTHGIPQPPSEQGMFDEFMDVVSFDFSQKPRGPPIEYGKALEIQ